MSAPSAHSSYEELVLTRTENNEYREGYAEARQACMIGQAVRRRRLALGCLRLSLQPSLA